MGVPSMTWIALSSQAGHAALNGAAVDTEFYVIGGTSTQLMACCCYLPRTSSHLRFQ